MRQRFHCHLHVTKKPQQIENLQFYFHSVTTILWVTSSPTLIQGPQFGLKRLNGQESQQRVLQPVAVLNGRLC